MPSPLTSRDQFVVAAALLGSGAGVLTFFYTVSWGWIPALIMFPALIVRVFWRTMPSWLLLTWVVAPTLVGESLVVTQTAYLVVICALAVAAAGRRSHLDTVAMVLSVLSPFVILLLGASSDWHRRIGAWLWFVGLLMGWGFGEVIGRQWALIAELERTRTKLAEAAVAADRQRVARDLHDLVGHSFSVVLLHLAGARMILKSSPDDAAEALRQAEEVGRSGMDELRQALMLMHRGTAAPAPVEPGDPERLVNSYRDAGMRVGLTVTGSLDGVAAAPRIVLSDVLREALTNVAKHAPSPAAEVRIEVAASVVTLRVENAFEKEAGGVGLGLNGLAHRVGAIDGTLRAGPEGERWVVEVCLPRRLATVTS